MPGHLSQTYTLLNPQNPWSRVTVIFILERKALSHFFLFSISVCMCECMFACVGTRVWMYVCNVGVCIWKLKVNVRNHPPLFFYLVHWGKDPQLNPQGTAEEASFASPLARGPVSAFWGWMSFYHLLDCWKPNSGPQTCATSTLTTEPSLQSQQKMS